MGLQRKWAVFVLWICQTRLFGSVGIDSAVNLPGFPTLIPIEYINSDPNLNPNMLLFAGKRRESAECSEVPLPEESLLSRAESTVKGDGGMLLQGNRRSMNNIFTMKDTKSGRKVNFHVLSMDFWWDSCHMFSQYVHQPPHFIFVYTSSTAQGGRGSFKDSNPNRRGALLWFIDEAEQTDGPKGGWGSESLSLSLSLSLFYFSLSLSISLSASLYLSVSFSLCL